MCPSKLHYFNQLVESVKLYCIWLEYFRLFQMQLKKQTFLEKNEKLTIKEFATVLFVSFYPQSDTSSQKSSWSNPVFCCFQVDLLPEVV